MRYNQKGFVDPKDAKRYAGSSDPSKDWSEHLGVGMYALMMIKIFWVCTKFMRNLYFQRSEWEHYRISDEYMLLTYC